MPAKRKILIADDSRDFVLLIRRALEARGYETCAAHEGVRVIEAAVKQKPDLILLDLMMPAGDGMRVLESLRSQPKTKTLPVIVVTSMSLSKQELEDVLRKGAQDVLLKPFDHDDLTSKIKSILPD